MDKNSYLELARKNGWDKKIPRLEDGTYDCDIFGGHNVNFDFDIRISGNISLGDHTHLGNIFAGCDVTIGNDTDTHGISAGGKVTIGFKAHTWDIVAGDGVTIAPNVFIAFLLDV